MKTLNLLLQKKGRQVWSVTPDATVFDALRLMADKGIGAVLVMDGERVVGILSERDYARKVALEGRASRETPVREIMTPRVVYARADQTVEEAMAIMTEKRVRHLPVFQGDQLVGIVSIGDLVKEIISDQQFMIDQLINYITS
ncbi:CBS domain-containing protein [Kallotenue papyrolyticum]|uniref:CBS domain-containing protein n=1 Tax=Kallotenue papyrolyticum TaxID=1325125 RepID=UPI0004B08D1F|nr:CBS domain-containing protein [Kallotenue papyrolyticum]